MKLSDVFDQLAYGELSSLSLAVDGEVEPREVNKIITHVNLGLTELHKRFVLKRKTLTLQTLADKSRYVLLAKYGESAGGSDPYILDADDPFKDDIIEVLRLNDEKGNEVLLGKTHLNGNRRNTIEVVQPAYNILRFVSDVEAGTKFTVEYQANHATIPKVVDFESFDASKVDIDLPMTYLEALLFFIASRVITPISNNLGSPQEGTSYSALFEKECQDLAVQGLDVDQAAINDRFSYNGFV
ncbi:hypothetical protein [Acinetobacter baumannii]|uniref:hypothetical protein n=1 Tax=Acinetobacter baumannii TaxID=470 RepID=UPI0026E099F2|nr:hypothetical protein [Acinetobacter baumannii]MDO5926323.1 hypothetical protein [Acinetobacter baumannii]HDU7846651.1 hypothetical protein [Acinetobacter baumannii]